MDEKVSIIYELIDRASASLQAVRAKMADLGKTSIDAGVKAELFKQKMDSIGTAARPIAIGAGLVSASLIALGNSAVNAAGSMEQNRIAFEVMLGSAEKAKILMSDLKDLSLKSPMEYKDIVEYTRRLMAMGIPLNEVTNDIKFLGDIASGVGVEKMPQLVLAFGQVKTATKLTGMELRQFTEAGIPLLDALEKQTGKSAQQIKEDMDRGIAPSFELVREALIKTTSEGGRFHDMMQRQSETSKGKISNLKDAVGFLASGFGQTLLPAVNVVADSLSSLIRIFNNLSPLTKGIITTVLAMVAAMTSLGAILGGVTIAIASVSSALATLGVSASVLAGATGIGALVIAFGALTVAMSNVSFRNTINQFFAGKAAADEYRKSIDDLDKALSAKKWDGPTKASKEGEARLLQLITDNRKRIAEKEKEYSELKKHAWRSDYSEKREILLKELEEEKAALAQKEEFLKKQRALNANEKNKPQEVTGFVGEKKKTKGDQSQNGDQAQKGEPSVMQRHDLAVSELKASGDYTYEKEIALLEKYLSDSTDKYTLTNEEIVQINKQRNNTIAQLNKETFTDLLANEDKLTRKKKENGEYTYLDEISRLTRLKDEYHVHGQALTEINEKIEAVRREIRNKDHQETMKKYDDEWQAAQNYGLLAMTFELDNQAKRLEMIGLSEEEKTNITKDQEMKRKTVEDQYRGFAAQSMAELGDTKLSIEEQVLKGSTGFMKKALGAQLEAWGATTAQQATMTAIQNIVPTGGLSMLLLVGQLAGIFGAVAAGKTALNSIQLAEGGIVMPRPGGITAQIGEAGGAEAVIPLNSAKGRDLIGGGQQGPSEIILNADGTRVLAKALYRSQQNMLRSGELS